VLANYQLISFVGGVGSGKLMLVNQNNFFLFLENFGYKSEMLGFFENYKHRYRSTLAISTHVHQITNSF
jgi:hypothetical protein